MILSTRDNIEALRGLNRAEQLEATCRLVERGVIDYWDAREALEAVGVGPEEIELVELCARSRLAARRDYYDGGVTI